MASSHQQANGFRKHQANQPFGPPPPRNGANGSRNKVNNKTSASFTGASFGLNVNVTNGGGGAGGQSGQRQSHFLLEEPEFNSTEDVRNYCNHVRALMLQAAIELAMAAKILEARLAQAQTLPGDNPIQAKMRARKVGRKLKSASDGATAAAKSAVGAYGAFSREYADLMRPRPQQSTNHFKY